MPHPDRSSCIRARESLIELAMALEERRPPRHVALHLDACESCRAFASTLVATRSAFRHATLLSPELRRQTLHAVARRAARRSTLQWWLLPPAVALGVVLSFVLPLWLTDQLLRPFLGSSPVTVALGLAAVVSQALIAGAAMYVAASLTRRPAAPFGAAGPGGVT